MLFLIIIAVFLILLILFLYTTNKTAAYLEAHHLASPREALLRKKNSLEPFITNEQAINLPILVENEFDIDNPYIIKLERGLFLQKEIWQKIKIRLDFPLYDYTYYSFYGLPKTRDLIRQLHKLANPKADFDKKILVIGTGATQILNALIFAFYNKLKRKIAVTVMTPGYLDTVLSISSLHEGQAQYIPNLKNADLEFVASPNNPNGVNQEGQKSIPNIVYDRVNFWKYYMINDPYLAENFTFENEDTTVFSLPKMNGFSGSRIGYAFVRDPEIANFMVYYIVVQTHGIPVDSDLRHQTAIEWFLKDNNWNSFCGQMQNILKYRWTTMTNLLRNNRNIVLLSSQGPNAWVKTPGNNAKQFLLEKYGLAGTYGPEYGVSTEYARLNLLCTTRQFNEMTSRLQGF